MNEKPHVHDLEFKTAAWCSRHKYSDVRCRLVYGDQEVHLRRGPKTSEAKLRRLVQKIVRRHDQQSVLAGEREQNRERIQTELKELALVTAAEWAPEEVERKRHPVVKVNPFDLTDFNQSQTFLVASANGTGVFTNQAL